MRPRVPATTTHAAGPGSRLHSPRRTAEPAASGAPTPPTARGDDNSEFLCELEQVSSEIRDPVLKLRYIRGSLAHYASHGRRLRLLPSRALRRAVYRRLSARALARLRRDPGSFRAPGGLMGGVHDSAPAPHAPRRSRGGWGLVAAAAVAAASLAGLTRYGGRSEATARAATPALVEATSVSVEPAELPETAPTAGVWLVESGSGYEQFSNGLRVDTSMAVVGEPRAYHPLSRETGLGSEPLARPKGILFHTSESDIWPMEEAYNESLRDSSHRLLRYIRRHELYHYVIDRFGRVFRIVEEGSRANHAGHSIWADGDAVYLNLNAAFLGVCFETRWEGGHALPITQAQLAAARALTSYLRHRWEIPARRCVTHGITSVNPHRHLIGHHLDWARGFPFAALGLPDAYEQPAPSVALFGFRYDEDFLRVMGRPWPGVESAEAALSREAAQAGVTVEQLRREKQRLYDRWRREQKRADDGLETAASARLGVRGG